MNQFDKVYLNILNEAVKSNEFTEFLEKRKKGAHKIEVSARKKGGLSLLTAIHFKAKAVPYAKAIKHSTKENCIKLCEEQTDAVFEKLKDWKNMSMKDFQAITGELEAWGESYLKSKEINN
jgi:hypothetical protein